MIGKRPGKIVRVSDISAEYVQGGSFGRGQAFVDIELSVALQYKKSIVWRNFFFHAKCVPRPGGPPRSVKDF